MFAAIVDLERCFDELLQGHQLNGPPGVRLISAARMWSDAVWAAAQATGPLALARDDVDRGLSLTRRPVFICGAHRSGTTLVRDLLDGHPALSVLPAEGTFFTSLEAHLESLPREARLRFLGGEWLRRLANPINRPPYWLLGRSTGHGSPYLEFARAVMAWGPIIEERLGREISSWPLVAISLAYAFCTGGFAPGSILTRWVEKTPANERFVGRLWKEFPAATIVQVVRHPLAVFASRKRLEILATGAFRQQRSVLQELALSYRIALEHAAGESAVNYCLVRYEDLIENAPQVVDRIARAMNIAPLPILLRPTVAGMPSTTNSSFMTSTTRGQILRGAAQPSTDVLTRAEHILATACVGQLAEALGYRVAAIGSWQARMLRWRHRMW